MPATDREEFESRHDAVVRQEIEDFRQKAHEFLAGQATATEPRPEGVPGFSTKLQPLTRG